MKCKNCGGKRFFVDTLGIEHCSKCFASTMYITEATGRLSYKQIGLEKKLEVKRAEKHPITKHFNTDPINSYDPNQ
jgi:hypothetical protein